MSKSSQTAVLVKDFDINQLRVLPPQKMRNGNSLQIPLVYGPEGKPLLLQFGTIQKPFYTPTGLERYTGSTYEKVRSNDTAWCWNENYFNKMTNKFGTQVRFPDSQVEGSEGERAYRVVKQIIDKVVDAFVNGSTPDENGVRVPLWDHQVSEESVRLMMTHPLREASGPYDATIMLKTRYKVKKNANDADALPWKTTNSVLVQYTELEKRSSVLTLDTLVRDAEKTGFPYVSDEEKFAFMAPGGTGSFIAEFNPIYVMKGKPALTCDLDVALLSRKSSHLNVAQFADIPMEAPPGTMSFGAAACATTTNKSAYEPDMKRQKTVDGVSA